jgi:hypothetical protein
MKNFGHCNELKRLTREQYDIELADSAAIADWILVICAAIFAIILVFM